MLEYHEWKHVFKLDPNKEINDNDLERICESGTDGLIIGGSDGVTEDNILDLLMRIRRYSVPCALEVSSLETVTPGFDYYFIPSVLNSNSTNWITGLHHKAVKEFGAIMNWDEIVMEGYCVLNPESKVAAITESNTNLTTEDIVAYAQMAEKMFKLPIFYIEYSGVYGDVEVVKEVSEILQRTQLFYGGGIKTLEQAKEMAEFANTIVVGNIIYENIDQALSTVNVKCRM
ncbi:heptaprenylglyceryl phosphate synthase [Anaerobacillus isosaccharinicus]|uniref:Heptaprenylglyceryl phosphate synthase n=1 Tax=Anaerobacillus isosaccharinicus TaxID=1532552 RepID=A0A7S7RDC9_9BACI|nr:heptaprenylglyceryl phosphate synthase [Anaerobacillus isosaccharinicus]MBA5588750.1 heptaprenylglyceryl phosphate synthase [Anaerobacillus isosaccharinicus]QOY37850.1 heptaprenylglyceryl phosphate synthase [Anaerobacillus isosaccharinicus]